MKFIRDYDRFETKRTTYFMGMNSGTGFIGLHTDLFSEDKLKRVYIIKGASGTGKSSLMRRISNAAEAEGHSIVEYLCSSDHTSLDGIIIDGKIGVCDGTAPHTMDMKYPGATSELIDLSPLWDNKTLKEQQNDIIIENKRKKAAYIKAYRHLGNIDKLTSERYLDILSCCNVNKIEKFCNRLMSEYKESKNRFKRETVSLRCIGMKGCCMLDSLEKYAKNIVSISDICGSGYVITNTLSDALTKKGISHTISVDPISPQFIHDIYIEKYNTLITCKKIENVDKKINMARFTDASSLREIRGEMKLSLKCDNMMLEEALDALSQAGKAHFKLEDLYKSAMNFEKLNLMAEKIEGNILSEL